MPRVYEHFTKSCQHLHVFYGLIIGLMSVLIMLIHVLHSVLNVCTIERPGAVNCFDPGSPKPSYSLHRS